MAQKFTETAVRIWKSGKLVVSQATPTSKYQLWGVHRESNSVTHMKSLGEFDSLEEVSEFVSSLPKPGELHIYTKGVTI